MNATSNSPTIRARKCVVLFQNMVLRRAINPVLHGGIAQSTQPKPTPRNLRVPAHNRPTGWSWSWRALQALLHDETSNSPASSPAVPCLTASSRGTAAKQGCASAFSTCHWCSSSTSAAAAAAASAAVAAKGEGQEKNRLVAQRYQVDNFPPKAKAGATQPNLNGGPLGAAGAQPMTPRERGEVEVRIRRKGWNGAENDAALVRPCTNLQTSTYRERCEAAS